MAPWGWDRIKDWLLVHGAARGGGWAPSTARERIGDMRRIHREGPDVWELAEDDVEGYLASRIQEGVTNAAYNNDIIAVNGLARALWSLEDRPGSPPQWTMRRHEIAERVWLTDQEIGQLMGYRHPDTDTSRFYRAVLHFAFETALRPSEAQRVGLSNLRRMDGMPVIEISRTSKFGIRRLLAFTPEFFAPTRPFGAYLRWVREVSPDDNDELWWTPNAAQGAGYDPHPVSDNYLQRLLGRLGKDVGVHVNWQITRRTRAMQLLESGWGIEYVSRWLGHRSVTTTQQYLNITDRSMVELVKSTPPPTVFTG